MKHRYEIILDKSHDIWNWLDASRQPIFQGFSWRDRLSGFFLDFFDKIVGLPMRKAKLEISRFLEDVYNQNNLYFKKLQNEITDDFSKKFSPACRWIEENTKRPLFFDSYKIYLTTFPRSPYDAKRGAFYFNIYSKNGLTNTFMHEVLHFQFIHYWRNDPKSPVAKLSGDDFDFLKESLTVIIDDNAVPPADFKESGYLQAHHGFRRAIHKNWLRYHDFDRLVKYSLETLPGFLN